MIDILFDSEGLIIYSKPHSSVILDRVQGFMDSGLSPADALKALQKGGFTSRAVHLVSCESVWEAANELGRLRKKHAEFGVWTPWQSFAKGAN